MAPGMKKKASVGDRVFRMSEEMADRIGTRFGQAFADELRKNAPDIAKSVGQASGRASIDEILGRAKPEIDELLSKAEPVAREMASGAYQGIKDSIRSAARSLASRTVVGAGAGAAAADEDSRVTGALRGGLGGVIGGTMTRHLGTPSPYSKIPLTLLGSVLGGSAGGYTTKEGESHMESPKFKYAGVVLDWYDDGGETLKAMFPTLDDVPDIVKSASVRQKEDLNPEEFALTLLDQGVPIFKYACNDPGTTAMSALYFSVHGDKLPEEAQKVAASNILEACERFGMEKEAFVSSVPRVVDITGQLPVLKKEAKSQNAEDYAVVLPDGTKKYPIHSWDLVKTAEGYFKENSRHMEPQVRRMFASNLLAKADHYGYPIDPVIKEAGAPTYASYGKMRNCIDFRKLSFGKGSDEHQFLEDLLEKRAELEPEVYAECLSRFDVDHGLDRKWNQEVPDPWSSTYGVKTAEVIWEDGPDRLTDAELENLALNRSELSQTAFTPEMVAEFQKDPRVVFESLPLPQKRMLARLAADCASCGESEGTGSKTAGVFGVRKAISYGRPLLTSPAEKAEYLKALQQLKTFGTPAPTRPGSEVMKEIAKFKSTPRA